MASFELEVFGDENTEKAGYVRLSEYVEVTFPALKQEEIAGKLLGALDIKEQKIRENFQKELDALNETRQNLLALTLKPSEPQP